MSPSAAEPRTYQELPAGRVLPAAFFGRPSDEVAPDLIGKVLWRRGVGGGRLTEVEAYLPEEDPASHGARGRTGRNSPMFGPAGCVYVFLSYGVHKLLNIVCDREAVGSAVLIRSFEPVEGLGHGFCSGALGPGVVGRLLGISLEMSGLSLGEQSGIFVVDDGERPEVGRATRVGISRGEALLLRHYKVCSRYVSGPARAIGGQRG